MLLAIVLVLVGLAFVVAEVFFVSFGLMSLIAGGLILFGDVLAFQVGHTFGWILVVLEVILVPVLVRGAFVVLPRLPFGRRMVLGKPSPVLRSGRTDLSALVGERGRALSDLRPAGTVEIGGQRMSVIANGPFIPREAEIEVVAVEGSEVRVRLVHPLPEESETPLL